ncbi:related to Molybdopterin synthase small subunit [Ustilago trichophora]|uniref:Molybdopterin synthase sulfur carrier subunit n=1 Tax=Ustilago trichophora TaxID=86804 RepID=A0A5C3EH47_9BASI|nr:related to Molybdopterin synthase small subunit [Ustilago trichophora]
MSSGQPLVKVYYFASVRTTLGLSSETLPLPKTPFPLTALISLIASRYSSLGAETVFQGCRWSVDNTLIEIEDIAEWTLTGGEEVAAIPPVSGG